jgi:hypothetical protein
LSRLALLAGLALPGLCLSRLALLAGLALPGLCLSRLALLAGLALPGLCLSRLALLAGLALPGLLLRLSLSRLLSLCLGKDSGQREQCGCNEGGTGAEVHADDPYPAEGTAVVLRLLKMETPISWHNIYTIDSNVKWRLMKRMQSSVSRRQQAEYRIGFAPRPYYG